MTRPAYSGGRHRVGLISDTHGTLDPRVADAFKGVERILHAGDIGRPEVLWELQQIAPVAAVLGNVDLWDMPGEDYPTVAHVNIDGICATIVHVRADAPIPGESEACDVIVFGHSHMPLVQEVDGVLWVNPGSASQARRSPIGRSVGILDVTEDGRVAARIVPLSDYGDQQ